ncbi:GNAT family N-acetyltransferase [Streptomyces sp. NPDC051041]|uniref:GNAT family N-acetyltransferase n=1 Tax=Streptomyces sp. NPDC051041 TaxID=3365640 RepID=UPI0037BC2D7D
MRFDDWHLTHDLDDFLGRAGAFLRSAPALHTVPLTVTETLRARGPYAYGDEAPEFGVLERDGTVRASFFRTPPHWLNLTALTGEEADGLAALLAGRGLRLPGVNAERGTAAAFAEAWRRRTGATAEVRQRLRLYRLGTLTAPRPVPPGRPRTAGAADREQLVRWFEGFCRDTGEGVAQDAARWADARIDRGDVLFWEAPDGTPVSMAGVSPRVAGQVRVFGVYTPAPLRGRGYAGAVTAEAGRAALASGAREVLLFADLANPTSNGLYQRIGYRPVADFDVHVFHHGPSPARPSGPQ